MMIQTMPRLMAAAMALATLVPGAARAQGGLILDPAADRDAIKQMAGCYDVQFDYQETFVLAPGYKLAPADHLQATEYVGVVEDAPDRVSLQHILVFPGGVQKHWRDTWERNPVDLLEFRGGGLWVKRLLTPDQGQGTWVQSVASVDDSPRYACAAPWIHWGDQNYWECSTWAPLPRREQGRTDYNVLGRRVRHQLTSSGWVLEEDNVKQKVTGTQVSPVVREKGQNVYTKIDDGKCLAAARWWEANGKVWREIQATWDELYAERSEIRLKDKGPDGKSLVAALFQLADQAAADPTHDAAALKRQARAVIDAYLLP